jgi:agmatinase
MVGRNVHIIGLPFGFGGLGKTTGAADGPRFILEQLKGCTNEKGHSLHFTSEVLQLLPGNIGGSLDLIYERATRVSSRGVYVGGDHTVTYATFKAFVEKNPGAGLLIFDAHLDCMQPFSIATHENFVRQLIEDGIIDASRVVIVGARTIDEEEVRYMNEKKLSVFSMAEIAKDGMREVCDAVMAKCKDFPALYVSVDIDALDASAAPGTGYPEPGGLSTRELLYFISRIKLLKNVGMTDVVEVSPDLDVRGITVNAAVKIIQELA